ncbi:unnamed protein product [Kluyveromyces dobzhanskii CBS 2104]|uniref:WGS project CCBQ000000000 data, contig 00016 n=1 Tax=Kluyveromyces dobzhanskii CBS 2104 TaxID=1427455 RepID=A0A0A8L1U9_9SACH|nr:unnamed protein product [Kluyveromyces dobzhanskii CBS 2104]
MDCSGPTSPRNAFIGDKRDWFKVNGELDASEDCDPSDYDIEDESFGLPLKSRHLAGNFDDILQSADSKKVRFVEAKNRMTVEQLLENTSKLNLVYENSVEEIADFKSGLDVKEWYRSTTPDTTTGASAKATASAGSASNFQLSEAGDRDTSTAGGAESDQESNVFDRRLSNLLASTPVSNYKLNNQAVINSQSDLNALSKCSFSERLDEQRNDPPLTHSLLEKNSGQNGTFDLQMTSEEALKLFNDFFQLALRLSSEKNDGSTSGVVEKLDESTRDSEKSTDDSAETNNIHNDNDNNDKNNNDNDNNDNNNPNVGSSSESNSDSGTKVFVNSSGTGEDMAMGMGNGSHENLDEASNTRAIFQMKSVPTLSAPEYLDRIQSKCSFPPIIYLTASSLLVTFCDIKYDHSTGNFHLENPITKSMVHRLIIAFIRVATKLLEDNVHSHFYFSKVCGVSKKLLSKLELNLILILRDTEDGLLNSELSIKTVLALHGYINFS